MPRVVSGAADDGGLENKQLAQSIMEALARAERQPLVDAMADDVSWRWMGVSGWSKTFEGKQQVIGELFGEVEEPITSFSV